jgi:hypothetical protein
MEEVDDEAAGMLMDAAEALIADQGAAGRAPIMPKSYVNEHLTKSIIMPGK